MLKYTLNLAPRLIHTKNLNFEGDELTVVACILTRTQLREILIEK